MRMWDYGLVLLTILLLFLGGYYVGFTSARNEEPMTAKSDTIFMTDTTARVNPVPDTVVAVKRVPYPVLANDTIRDTIYLDRESKTYRDSAYTAVVSGIDPSLDFIEVYNRVRTITNIVEIERKSSPKWSLGIQTGIGANVKGLSPYIGIGVQYNLLSF